MLNRTLLLLSCVLVPSRALAQPAPAAPGAARQGAPDSAAIETITAQVRRALERYYVYPDKARAAAQAAGAARDQGRYAAAASRDELARLLERDIRSVLKDRHFRLEFNPDVAREIDAFAASGAARPPADPREEREERRKNYSISRSEVLPGNTGYISIRGFAAPSPAAIRQLRAALQFVAHTDALIIDLRNNFGGNGEMAGAFSSHFFRARTLIGRSFNRIDNRWTSDYVRQSKPLLGETPYTRPLAILVSERTFSAAEAVAYTLQGHRGATVVGRPTRGGAHLTRSFSVGNGFVAYIPYRRGVSAVTGTDWEGTGVLPDTNVTETHTLLVAQARLLTRVLAGTKDTVDRAKLSWQLRYIQSQTSQVTVDTSAALRFLGRFREFAVTLKEGALYFRDTNQRSGDATSMVPITATVFQVGLDYQVEFILDAEGRCNRIRMYWDDGWIEDTERSTEPGAPSTPRGELYD